MSSFKLQSQNITLNKKGNTDPIYTSNYAVALDDLPNSSGGSLLPEVTSEDDGKVLKVAEGEWQAEENRFIITLTNNNGTYTADKTEAEMLAAYQAGKELSAIVTLTGMPFMLECSGVIISSGVLLAACFGGLTLPPDGMCQPIIAQYFGQNYPVLSGIWAVSADNVIPLFNGSTDETDTIEIGINNAGNARVKTYSETGSNEDGTMTQAAITDAINGTEVLDPTQYPNLASQFNSMVQAAFTKALQNIGKVVSVVLTANDETLIPYWNEMEALVSAANSVDNPILGGFKTAYKSNTAVNTVWFSFGDADTLFCISCYSITDGHGGYQFSVKAVMPDVTQYTPS